MNHSGLLSVTIFKQLQLPGDRQHTGSWMEPMQDLAQTQLVGGREQHPEPFPSLHCLERVPWAEPLSLTPRQSARTGKATAPSQHATQHCEEQA